MSLPFKYDSFDFTFKNDFGHRQFTFYYTPKLYWWHKLFGKKTVKTNFLKFVFNDGFWRTPENGERVTWEIDRDLHKLHNIYGHMRTTIRITCDNTVDQNITIDATQLKG